MARSRGGRVSKHASQTLPVRGTQPRPLIGVRTVQTMITHFSRQDTPGLAQEGDQAGRIHLFHPPFQVQPAQLDQQQPVLPSQRSQSSQVQLEPGREHEVLEVAEINDTPGHGSAAISQVFTVQADAAEEVHPQPDPGLAHRQAEHQEVIADLDQLQGGDQQVLEEMEVAHTPGHAQPSQGSQDQVGEEDHRGEQASTEEC